MSHAELQALAAMAKMSEAELLDQCPGLSDPQAIDVVSRFVALTQARSGEPSRRTGPFSSTDAALRHQILTYHAAELMTDRERAMFFGLPNGCRIRERAKIIAPEKFECGENIWIGEGAVLDAQGGLSIGDNSQIGLGVMIWSHTSHKQAVSGETGVSRDKIQYRKTTIGRNVFIAGPAVVLPGVTIGDRAIISPMTVVDRDIAPARSSAPPKRSRPLKTVLRCWSSVSPGKIGPIRSPVRDRCFIQIVREARR